MRAAWAPAVLGMLLLGPSAPAEDMSAFAGSAASEPRAAASPVPPSPRLNLGPYRSVYADDPAALAEQLRFQEQVEVRGKPMDRASLTAKLEWWMKDYDLTRGATPATMSAPSIAEMRDYRPHPPDAIDLVPVMQWLTEKLSGRKK